MTDFNIKGPLFLSYLLERGRECIFFYTFSFSIVHLFKGIKEMFSFLQKDSIAGCSPWGLGLVWVCAYCYTHTHTHTHRRARVWVFWSSESPLAYLWSTSGICQKILEAISEFYQIWLPKLGSNFSKTYLYLSLSLCMSISMQKRLYKVLTIVKSFPGGATVKKPTC